MIIKMANDQFSQVKIVKVLLVFLAILIVLSLMIIISLPTIKKSIDASGVIPLIKNHISERKEEEKEILLTLYFPIPSAVDSTYRYTNSSIMVKNNSLIVHNFLEELLKGVPQGLLIEGAISYIPPHTSLIGYTVSNNIGYIHLSEEFLDSSLIDKSNTLRYEQVEKNLKSNFSLKDVIFIIKGEIINKNVQ